MTTSGVLQCDALEAEETVTVRQQHGREIIECGLYPDCTSPLGMPPYVDWPFNASVLESVSPVDGLRVSATGVDPGSPLVLRGREFGAPPSTIGAGVYRPPQIHIGGAECLQTIHVSDTQLQCSAPAFTGTQLINVWIAGLWGTSSLTVRAMVPSFRTGQGVGGPAYPGVNQTATITISGDGFSGPVTEGVWIDGIRCQEVLVESPSSMRCLGL